MRHLRSVLPSEQEPGTSPCPSRDVRAPLGPGDLASLLARTNRTFALAIPLLDDPLATDVGIAYLLFCIADALEGASSWGRDERLAALDSFGEWLVGDVDESTWLDRVATSPPSSDAGCLALLGSANALRSALNERKHDLAIAITMDVVRTSSNMAEFVSRQTDKGELILTNLADLRAYCYAVAGIVGELVTEMFLTRDPSLEPQRDMLMDLAPAFGEGLQLTKVLQGAGRVHLPSGIARGDVERLARTDLERANEYIEVLAGAGASAPILRFCELPVRLAEATLDRFAHGYLKLAREEVMMILAEVTGTLP